MAACECIVQLDPNDPIKAGKKHKIAKHTASVTFQACLRKKTQMQRTGVYQGRRIQLEFDENGFRRQVGFISGRRRGMFGRLGGVNSSSR